MKNLYLSENFFIIYGFLQVVGIAAFTFTFLAPFYLGATALLSLGLFFDYRSIRGDLITGGKLELPDVFKLRQTQKIKVSIEGTPLLARLSAIYAEFPLTDFLNVEFSKIPLDPREGSFTVTGKILGRVTLNNFNVLMTSPLRFWIRRKNINFQAVTCKIQPFQRNVSEQEFIQIARRNHFFVGNRVRTRAQAADQYLTSRKFQYPDSLRHIDHKKTAKYNELMTKSFEELRNHRLIIGLDIGRSMSGEIAGSSKHNYYLAAAMGLAKHAVKFQDTVDFFAFSNKVHLRISGAKSVSPFSLLLDKSEILRPRMEESNYEIINSMTTHLTGQRSIFVLLSDLSLPNVQATLLRSMGPICRKHLSVVVGMIDKRFHLDTQVLEFNKSSLSEADLARLTYCYWLNEQSQLFQTRISSFGGGSLALSEEEWIGMIEKLYLKLRQSSYS